MNKYIIQAKLWDYEWVTLDKTYDTEKEAYERAYEIMNTYKPETVFDIKVKNIDI